MKRKHPEHEERRATKKPQRDPVVPAQEGDVGRPQRDQAPSASPPESQNGLAPPQSGQSGEEGELEMDYGLWHTALRYEQGQLDHDHQHHHSGSINLAPNTSTSGEGDDTHFDTGPLTQQPSISESTYVSHFGQDATDLEQSLLLGASFHKPTHHFGTQMHSIATSDSTSPSANSASSNFNQRIPDSLLSNDLTHLQEDWLPSSSQTARGVHLYFTHVSHFVPFLHWATFDATQIPRHLLLSMLCLAYQHSEDPDCGEEVGSGVELSVHCFHRARVLLASCEERADDWKHNVTLIQAYLLLQICAMMYLCGEHSPYGLQMHSKMIFLARMGGLMQQIPIELATTGDLESLWGEFVRAESHKRTLFAVHQIDALWYQILSIPRSLSHLEIKHDLPCPADHWTASSSAKWAHRQLLTRHSGPSVKYADAVRRFLSPDPELDSLPAFGPYGAINIAQFLISSAREISGWSTMTGRLSIERLRSSLAALHPFICPPSEPPKSTHAVLREATWEMAMIELQIWSPSHTGGIVGGSLDAGLKQSTSLTPSKALQAHVGWFLLYLDATMTPDSEPPWIAFYAYKAFLIAWQLVCGGLSGAMQVVSVQDGDVEGAMAWGRKVFLRRQRWQLGNLIMTCLDELDK